LFNDPKFSKNVFAITSSIVILLSSVTVFASKAYFNKKSEDSQPKSQVQNIKPKKAESEIKQEPIEEEIKSESTSTSTDTKAPTGTQTTPPSTTKPSCNVSKKTELTNKYNADINEARQERDQLLNEANAEYASAGDRARERYRDIWDPDERGRLVAQDIAIASTVLEQSRSYANNDYNSTEMYLTTLTTMYNLDLKSINCSN